MLFNVDGYSPEHVGEMLADKGFCLRTGYHCSALAHKALGTENTGGVRIGFGIFNTEREVGALCSAIGEISRS